MEDRYWIALFKEGGESAGVERELAREHVIDIAQSKYKQSEAMYPNRIVMLCDRATVLARSDRNPARRIKRIGNRNTRLTLLPRASQLPHVIAMERVVFGHHLNRPRPVRTSDQLANGRLLARAGGAGPSDNIDRHAPASPWESASSATDQCLHAGNRYCKIRNRPARVGLAQSY